MKQRSKIKKESDKIEDEHEFYAERSEKKYRSWKKTKRIKPPHKKWG